MNVEKYQLPNMRSRWGSDNTLVAHDLLKAGMYVGIRPIRIAQIVSDENASSKYLINIEFVKTDRDDARNNKLGDDVLTLTNAEFDNFRSAYEHSRNGVVVFRSSKNFYEFEAANGFTTYVDIIIETRPYNKMGKIARLLNLPSTLSDLIADVRLMLSESHMRVVTHKIQIERETYNNMRDMVSDFKHKLIIANDRYIRKCADVNRLGDRLRANYDESTEMEVKFRARILELENQLKNQEEDVLLEAERIKARVHVEAQSVK